MKHFVLTSVILAHFFAGNALSQTAIIEDSFTSTRATPLSGRQPDLSLPGTSWTQFSLGVAFDQIPYLEPTTGGVQTRFNGGGYLDIRSASGFVKPTILSINATLTVNNLSGVVASGAGVGLGFYGSPPPEDGMQAFSSFVGLLLSEDGALSMVRWLAGNDRLEVLASVQIPDFNPATPYALAYRVNTKTGAIESVSVDGVEYTESFSGLSGVFDDGATNRAGFYGKCEHFSDRSGTVDDFSVLSGAGKK